MLPQRMCQKRPSPARHILMNSDLAMQGTVFQTRLATNLKRRQQKTACKKQTCSSSSVRFSPSSSETRFRFLNEIFPVSSSSNRRNALRISSFVSFSAILDVMRARKSSKQILPANIQTRKNPCYNKYTRSVFLASCATFLQVFEFDNDDWQADVNAMIPERHADAAKKGKGYVRSI